MKKEKETFWRMLDDELQKVTDTDVVFIRGDLNEHLNDRGERDMKRVWEYMDSVRGIQREKRY